MARRCLNMALRVLTILAAFLIPSSAAQTIHVVGDSMGWTTPSGGDEAYRVWVENQNFTVGDSLVFNFPIEEHDVAEVSKADYDACTSSNPISVDISGLATIKLNSSGEHYFICNYGHHCIAGQKLAINVSATGTTTFVPPPPTPEDSMAPATTTVLILPKEPSPTPISAPPSSPSSSEPVTYIVGDALYWTAPVIVGANPDSYQIWAANKRFKVGDKLVFNYVTGRHDVKQVDESGYDSCDSSFSTLSLYTTSPTSITLNSPGEYFFICSYPTHCSHGQKLAINVTAGTTPSSHSLSDGSSSAGNSASFLGVVEVSATFLSIIVTFFLV